MSRGIKFITLMLAVLLLLGASAVLAENGAAYLLQYLFGRFEMFKHCDSPFLWFFSRIYVSCAYSNSITFFSSFGSSSI